MWLILIAREKEQLYEGISTFVQRLLFVGDICITSLRQSFHRRQR